VRVVLYGQFPTPGPPRSDIEDLLQRGGAIVMESIRSLIETTISNNSVTSYSDGSVIRNGGLLLVRVNYFHILFITYNLIKISILGGCLYGCQVLLKL